MKDKKTIRIVSTIIGVVIAIVLLVVGYNLVSNVFTRASGAVPTDVTISDITTTSVKVNWSSSTPVIGVIPYGTSPTALNFFAPESQATSDHSVDLTLLSPGTTYYFSVKVDGKEFNNGGIPWSFSTKAKSDGSQAQTISPTSHPSPIQTLVIPTVPSQQETPTSAPSAVCSGTDCAAIKAQLGTGCQVEDYLKCLDKTVTPTPTP